MEDLQGRLLASLGCADAGREAQLSMKDKCPIRAIGSPSSGRRILARYRPLE
jgi:hypothetical protein